MTNNNPVRSMEGISYLKNCRDKNSNERADYNTGLLPAILQARSTNPDVLLSLQLRRLRTAYFVPQVVCCLNQGNVQICCSVCCYWIGILWDIHFQMQNQMHQQYHHCGVLVLSETLIFGDVLK